MQFLRLVLAILYISSICYASDREDIDILREIAKSSVERDLVESGRYELFKSVLDVYHFALDINEKVSEVLLNKNLHLEPVQGAGLGLYIVIDTNPIYLCMPWGRLDIDGGLLAMDSAKQVTDAFFEKLKLSFESHEAEQEYRRHNVKVDPSVPVVFYGVGRKGLFEIPEQNLKQYRGTSILIKSNVNGNFSCYRIDEIDGKPLPVQKERPLEKDRSLHDISYEWDLLNIMHNKELAIKYQREVMRAKQIFLNPEKRGEY